MTTWIWSDGFGQGEVKPWLSLVNHSGEGVATATLRMRRDAGGPMVTWHRNVEPWSRVALDLTDVAAGSHFWLSVQMDREGGATLVCWRPDYAFPPYVPPATVVQG